MNDKKSVDWSVVLLGAATALMIAVAAILVGGWLFSVAWGAFIVPVFALPVIDIGQGIAAMFLLYAAGFALGFRKNVTQKVS